MHYTRLDFSSQILKDGRLYVAGGEYGTGKSNGEVYDPLTNLWTNTPLPGNVVSDACSAILEDGRVLQSLVGAKTGTVIYNPIDNTYIPGPSTHGGFGEAAWVKLPDNSLLQVDINSKNSERYIQSLNKWVVDATVPVNLYDSYGSETGAGFLLPNGRAFMLGSPGTTALYTPSGDTTMGTWVAGPTIPNGGGTPDAPAAMMVNGKILAAISPIPTSATHFPAPLYFYEYDYVSNTFTQTTAPGGVTSLNHASYYGNMLDLPDGKVLYGEQGSKILYVYTPDGTPLTAGKPTVTKIVPYGTGSYAMTGTLFNGISEGAAYGDDEQMATNYPIVRLTRDTNVYYARTYNWNSTGVQRGNRPDTAFFTLPTGLSPATYSLSVIVNGIGSDPISFTPGTIVSLNHNPDASALRRFNAVAFGSTLTLRFRVDAEVSDGSPLHMQLVSVDGHIVHQEQISGSGEFERRIDLSQHGKGIYLFVLDNGKGRITRSIAVQ
ncbi:MAG TPA: hypothetical protein DCQ83_00100 [Fibrobacteres bacterium]|nr:hypothetical protein [Fibrobacterota bacterium]